MLAPATHELSDCIVVERERPMTRRDRETKKETPRERHREADTETTREGKKETGLADRVRRPRRSCVRRWRVYRDSIRCCRRAGTTSKGCCRVHGAPEFEAGRVSEARDARRKVLQEKRE